MIRLVRYLIGPQSPSIKSISAGMPEVKVIVKGSAKTRLGKSETTEVCKTKWYYICNGVFVQRNYGKPSS